MNLIKRIVAALRPGRSKPIEHATDPQRTPGHSPRFEVDTENPTAVTTRTTNFR